MQYCKQVVQKTVLIAIALGLLVTAANAQWSAKLIAVPKINIGLNLGSESRAELVNFIHEYANRQHFQIIDGGGYPDFNGQPMINLSLVRGDGVEVDVVSVDFKDTDIYISIFSNKEDAPWSVAATQLIEKLRARWPKAIKVSYPATTAKPPAKTATTLKATIVIHLNESALAKFVDVIHGYAKREGFKVANELNTTDMNGRHLLGVKLVRDDGVEIDVQGIDINIRGYWITVDANKQNAAWRSATLRLVRVLQSTWWPNAVTVEYPTGTN